MILFAGFFHDLNNRFPWSRLKKQKRDLREVLEQRRRVYDASKAELDSQTLVERISQLPQFQQAQTVMLYMPIHNEVNLKGLLDLYEGQKTFLLPVTHRRSMQAHPYAGEENMIRGKYRVVEPTTPPYKGSIDLILVPGVAFDKQLHRLGRGGGFYDKFLRKHPQATKMGVGYDFQIYKKVLPHSLLDVKLDAIITPTKSIGC
ncbi:MAG: 5-formyltetrahydrofolate cyclo-ligase [Paludibacteraceae bacterium]|nr:5-formyltetrahydrofolate cyclo-ligase [Paludibacteraceae bacterium]